MERCMTLVSRILATTSAKSTPFLLMALAEDCVAATVGSAEANRKAVQGDLVAWLDTIVQPEKIGALGSVEVCVAAASIKVLHAASTLAEVNAVAAVNDAWVRLLGAVLVAHLPSQVVEALYYASAILRIRSRLVIAPFSDAMRTLELGGHPALSPLPLGTALKMMCPLANLLVVELQQRQPATAGDPHEALAVSIIEACLALAATPSIDQSATAMASRRILIPLLSSRQTLTEEFTARISTLLQRMLERNSFSEFVVSVASLFELLFASLDLHPLHDFRCANVLWRGLSMALQATLPTSATIGENDVARNATMQLQVVFLLKRIVATTHEQEPSVAKLRGGPAAPPALLYRDHEFHPLFPWVLSTSESCWNQWFLVFETLNEFGVHINAPALAKLEDLAAHMGNAIAPLWYELLIAKALSHPNTGVRKLMLRKLWDHQPSTLARLSPSLICQSAFVAAADVRLCTDLDRVVLAGNFLDCRILSEGREDFTAPTVLPLAEHMQSFYLRYLTDVCGSESRQAAALSLVLSSVERVAPRFSVATLFRVLWFVSCHLRAPPLPSAMSPLQPLTTVMTVPVESREILDACMLSQLQGIIKELVHDRHPYWLEARLNAMALDTVMRLGLLRSHYRGLAITRCSSLARTFRRLLASTSACGGTGGRSVAVVDASESAGCIGAALRPHDAATYIHRTFANSFPDDGFAREMVADLTTTMSALQQHADASTLLSSFDPMEAKERFAYVSCVDDESLRDLASFVVTELESHATRPYVRVSQLCRACSQFVELHRSSRKRLGSLVCCRSLTRIFALVAATGNRQVEACIAALRSGKVTTLQAFSEEDSVWDAVRSNECDAVQSVLSNTISVFLSRTSDAEFLVTALPISETIQQGVAQLVELSTSPTLVDLPPCAQLGWVMLCRAVARRLQAVMSPFAAAQDPSCREQLLSRLISLQNAESWSADLRQHCMRLRTQAGDIPTNLTSLSSGTISAQYFRYLFNVLYMLGLAVEPMFVDRPPSNGEDPETLRLLAFCETMEEFALDQLDRCSTSNLSSVFDMVAWTMRTRKSPRFALVGAGDRCWKTTPERLVASMFSHLDASQRREFLRCSAVAIASLKYCDDAKFIRDTVTKLLREECDSERIILLCSMVLCSIVRSQPETMWPTFRETVLEIAVLYNSGRDEEEMEACLAVTEPAVTESCPQLRVDAAPSVRLGSLARALAISTVLSLCQASPATAMELTTDLMQWNVSNKTIAHEPCMPNSKTHRCRVRLWQLLCGILPALDPSSRDWENLLRFIMSKVLPINNMGSVRRFMELYLIGAFFRSPVHIPLLSAELDKLTLRTQICGTYALVAVHLLLEHEPSFELLFPKMMRLCTSHQHLLRVISHIGIHEVLRRRSATHPSWRKSPEVAALFDFIDRAPENIKFREKHEGTVLFDSREALSARQLFCMQRKETTTWLKESIPAAAFARVRFLRREFASLLGATTAFEELRCAVLEECLLGRHAHGTRNESTASDTDTLLAAKLIPASVALSNDEFVDYTKECLLALVEGDELQEVLSAATAAATSPSENIQRKVTSWWNSELWNELHPRSLGSSERTSLIVVGSLLENPVNIAGLCRCGDIFAVERIVVPDKKVFEHAHFAATARSAELWIPWEEVNLVVLSAYLQQKRLEGYTIVGVEQTRDSVPLVQYRFPERVVMLLGSEGQGIPAEYIALLDACVEIPQYGLIRSLNVHVTGAIVMYEFARQHLMQKGSEVHATPLTEVTS